MHVRALCFTEHSCTRRKSEGGRWSPADITETGKVEVPRCWRYVGEFQRQEDGAGAGVDAFISRLLAGRRHSFNTLKSFWPPPEEPGESLEGCWKFPEGLRWDSVGHSPRLDRRTLTIGIYAWIQGGQTIKNSFRRIVFTGCYTAAAKPHTGYNLHNL